MKEKSKLLSVGEGIGKIRFGMSRNQVKEVAGEPDEIEMDNDTETDTGKTEAWHYDDAELSLSFEEFNKWQLTSIAVSSPEFMLRGIALIGKEYSEVMAFLGKFNFGEALEEEIAGEDDVIVFLESIEDSGLNFWFENNILTEIQFSQLWENGDE
jgi:hypothetical protein